MVIRMLGGASQGTKPRRVKMKVKMLSGEGRKYASLFVFVGKSCFQAGITWQYPGRECPIFVYRPVPRDTWASYFGLEGDQR